MCDALVLNDDGDGDSIAGCKGDRFGTEWGRHAATVLLHAEEVDVEHAIFEERYRLFHLCVVSARTST